MPNVNNSHTPVLETKKEKLKVRNRRDSKNSH